MKKVTVTCENLFTGEDETLDLYFHLTEAELAMLNISANNKYAEYENNKENMSNEESIKLFEAIIEKAYGQKTEDGRFIKDETARKAFLCSPAYSALLMNFINGDENIAEFVMGCLPKKVSSKMTIGDDGQIKLKE